MAAKQRTMAKTGERSNSTSETGSRQPPASLPGYFSAAATGDDRLIYEKIRLGIVSALSINDNLSFSELKTLLQTSDGNLSVHARKLEDAGYVNCKKTFQGRVPKTQYQLTSKGQRAFQRYLDHMEALIHMARNG